MFIRIMVFVGLILCFSQMKAQVFISKIDSVVYSDYVGNASSLMRRTVAQYAASYIKKYYSEKKLPQIYLYTYEGNEDTLSLAYDNFYGNALENDIYEKRENFYSPGIRIVFITSKFDMEVFLKILDFGINHIKVLEKKSRQIHKLGYYDRPKSPILDSTKMNKILNAKTSSKIKQYLNDFPFR